MLKLNEPFRNQEIFIISFFNSSDLGFESKIFFLQFLFDILSLGSGSVDSHIFPDPDPGSQNLADPTDPDPKHWFEASFSFIHTNPFCLEKKILFTNSNFLYLCNLIS